MTKLKVCRPNILFIMTDEMRAPPVYETEAIKEWSKKELKAQKFLRKHGTEFTNHYIGSTACAPSRATIFTGQYPSLHGVSQTSGIAKTAFDADMFWLDENTVPTMGDWIKAAGYRTYYFGKWHVSDEDILIPGTKTALNSYDIPSGIPNEYAEIYLDSQRLQKYGFKGWIGPEPHGTSPYNSASSAPTGIGGRDIVFSQQIVNKIRQLDRSVCDHEREPWLLVASFLNPHDITLYGDLTANSPLYNFEIDPTVPEIPPAPTANEDLSTKPSAQLSYKNVYQQAVQPTTNTEKYRKFYYSLQKRVDEEIYKVLKALRKTSMYEDTIIIFTSDHGELLGSHGGLFQKWHNSYQESIKVPFIIHNPILCPEYRQRNDLTSHLDIIPTMLSYGRANIKKITDDLKVTHTEVHKLVGKPIKLNEEQHSIIYFMTGDEPTTSAYNTLTYTPVTQPNNIETVICYINKQLYKYNRYFDPNSSVEEFEMYNLSTDPTESINLVYPVNVTPENTLIRNQLNTILTQQRQMKRLTPKANNI